MERTAQTVSASDVSASELMIRQTNQILAGYGAARQHWTSVVSRGLAQPRWPTLGPIASGSESVP